MTTTAFDDQFTVGTQTIEPVRQPYDTVAILRRNIADMEVALRTQTERAEAAEAELARLREQKPIKHLYRVTDCFGNDVLREENERLRGWIRVEGGFNDTCPRQILGEVCHGCRCGKTLPEPAP